MPNSPEQSLDEDAVFLPVTEASPHFLYCEKERRAVERLLSSGPEAFYESIGAELSGCFLSPEEVRQISSWAQDYRFTPPPAAAAAQNGAPPDHFSSTYFPPNSDVPTPDLELGWPEKDPWPVKVTVKVHTNPPAEGDPPVREIIRQQLQQASKVIAIVTDRLSDCAVIRDLHSAASRGVAVYIILNQRSLQETFKIKKLRHPNMRVRVIGGKTFCSRMGRVVVGEMKAKFLLVDLKTVVHGSHSLTWTDTHLHRQMITVLQGPVVDSFDREFRTLFAASLPVPDACTTPGSPAEVGHHPKNATFLKHVPLELDISSSPPSPLPDSYLDWEAMGVVPIDVCVPDRPSGPPEETAVTQSPVQRTMYFDSTPPVLENFAEMRNQFFKSKGVKENTSPVTNYVPDKAAAFNNAPPSPNNVAAPEKIKREETLTVKNLSRRHSLNKNTNLEERLTKRSEDRHVDPNHNMSLLSPTKRERSKAIIEEEPAENENGPKVESTLTSRKPLILKLPQSESFSSLNDLMNRTRPQENSHGKLHRASKVTHPELSQSMMDLSVHKPDQNPVPVPRFQASCFDPDCLSSTIALIKKRSDDLKPSLYKTPKSFAPRERPRSSTYGLDLWRRSLLERDEDSQMGVKK